MRQYQTAEEILKDIPGYENLYAATQDGRIWSYRRKKFMKICNGNKGYQQITVVDKFSKSKNAYVHRLVALTWLPNPENLPDINHKDEDKTNNDVSNLEWCTRQYNVEYSAHKIRKPVYCIELDKTFESTIAAAEYLGCSQANITIACQNPQYRIKKYHLRYAEEQE